MKLISLPFSLSVLSSRPTRLRSDQLVHRIDRRPRVGEPIVRLFLTPDTIDEWSYRAVYHEKVGPVEHLLLFKKGVFR